MSCAGDHCVTCSDEAVPMRVDAVRPGAVAVAVCDATVEVMTDLVGAVEPGEILLVHGGVAIAKVEA